MTSQFPIDQARPARLAPLRMMRGAVLAVLAVSVLGCASPEQPSAEAVAREAVKAVIRPVLGEQFPGVPSELIVDCVIDNASAKEIVEIANAALLGNATDSLYVILPIAQRPQTLQCIAGGAAGLF